MAENNKKGLIIGLFLGGIGCLTFLGLFVLLVMFIGVPKFAQYSERVKEGMVIANISEASYHVQKNLDKGLPPKELVDKSIEELNSNEDFENPYDPDVKPFGKTPAPGVVTIVAVDDDVELTGYDKKQQVLETKTITKPKKE